MRRSRLVVVWVAVAAMAAGCSLSGVQPQAEDVGEAAGIVFLAVGKMVTVSIVETSASTARIVMATPDGRALYEASGVAFATYLSVTGTLEFTSYRSISPACTVSGGAVLMMRAEYSTTVVEYQIDGALTLSGGPIRSLEYHDVSFALDATSGELLSVSGTVTADGWDFDVADLL